MGILFMRGYLLFSYQIFVTHSKLWLWQLFSFLVSFSCKHLYLHFIQNWAIVQQLLLQVDFWINNHIPYMDKTGETSSNQLQPRLQTHILHDWNPWRISSDVSHFWARVTHRSECVSGNSHTVERGDERENILHKFVLDLL